MSARTEPVEEETNWRQRIVLSAIGVVAILLTYTLVYQWAMATYEDVQISFLHSLRIVIETLTTAGFGGDTDYWQSEPIHFLIVLMNLSGVLLVFLAIPLFVVPMFRQVFQPRPPTSSNLSDHVIICGYSPQDEILRAELETVGTSYLYVDPDSDLVTDLNEDGINAMVGDPERIDTLRAANAEEARGIVADIDDETNPAVILAAKQVDPDLYTISVVRKPEVETYHRYAQADEVVLNRRVMGKSLGLRASGSYAEKLQRTIEVESDIQVTELRVEKGSDLVGQSIKEATVLEEMGVNVIGAWLGGKFVVTPDPDTVIVENTVLLVAGEYKNPDNVRAQLIPTHENDDPRVVVCGYGTVGQAITETVREEGMEVEVIDIEPKDGVDIVGDISDPETFERADVENARAVVLSIDEDATTIYATLVLNQLAPDTELIVRADDADSVQKLYNSGADFALSLPAVTGEILASLLIDETEILTPDISFEFERTRAPAFAGRTLSELDVRRRTGCTIVAVERDGELVTEPGGDFVVQADDVLIVAGRKECHRRLRELIEQ